MESNKVLDPDELTDAFARLYAVTQGIILDLEYNHGADGRLCARALNSAMIEVHAMLKQADIISY